MTKTIKTLILILFSVIAMTMTTGGTVFGVTWLLENGGGYWEKYGTFNYDSYCGLRGSCHWGYNKQQPSPPTCWGYDEPGTGCDAYRRKWAYWNFVNAYSYPDQYRYTRSRQYVFISAKHGTTRWARYFVLGYLNGGYSGMWTWTYVNQYAYYNRWVPLNQDMLGIWKIYQSDVTVTGEPTNWYQIQWDATKVEY